MMGPFARWLPNRTSGLPRADDASVDSGGFVIALPCAPARRQEHLMSQHNVSATGKFQVRKLEERIAPKITKVNGGGHTPSGEANGIPSKNPSGHEPGGH